MDIKKIWLLANIGYSWKTGEVESSKTRRQSSHKDKRMCHTRMGGKKDYKAFTIVAESFKSNMFVRAIFSANMLRWGKQDVTYTCRFWLNMLYTFNNSVVNVVSPTKKYIQTVFTRTNDGTEKRSYLQNELVVQNTCNERSYSILFCTWGGGGSLACRGPQWPVGTDKVPLRGKQSCWQEIPTQGGQVAPTIC